MMISQRSRKNYLNLIYIGILKGQRIRGEPTRRIEKIVLIVTPVVLRILVLRLKKMDHKIKGRMKLLIIMIRK